MSTEFVLGVSYGHHESSCCLLSSSGEMVYLREEWLSRVKGDHRLPALSLDFIHANYPGAANRIRAVCLFEKPLRNWLGSGLEPGLSHTNYLAKIRQFRDTNMFFEKEIRRHVRSKYEVMYCPHHLSHALTTASFMDGTAGPTLHVVLDGYGDGCAGMTMLAADGEIIEIQRIEKRSSLGLLYSALTDWAGFSANEDEYKVMALAAYGEPRYLDHIEHCVCFYGDASSAFDVNADYFDFSDISRSGLTAKFVREFGPVALSPPDMTTLDFKHRSDVICSFQSAIERAVLALIESALRRQSDVTCVALSGGLFHNSKLVGVLSEHCSKPIFVCPSPGDAGSSIGAARFAAMHRGFARGQAADPFCGPRLESLQTYGHLFEPIGSAAAMSERFASLVADGQIVATFAGRCELGPRALGARSLLCDGANAPVVEALNTKLKAREAFRPLAPILSQRYAESMFRIRNENLSSTRWMGMLVWLKSASELSEVPPFVHRDGSARAQLVLNSPLTAAEDHPPHDVFSYVSRAGPLINTSFNVAGDPMVFSPEDCYVNARRLGVQYVMTHDNIYRVRT